MKNRLYLITLIGILMMLIGGAIADSKSIVPTLIVGSIGLIITTISVIYGRRKGLYE